MIEEHLLCQSQLAKRWNVSERKLEADRYKGTGCTFVKIGSCVRYRLAEVIAYEEAQRRTSTSDKGVVNELIHSNRLGLAS